MICNKSLVSAFDEAPEENSSVLILLAPDDDDDDDDNDYLRLQHGKEFRNLVYMSYVKHINLAKRHK
jgi:hypothetical protein